MSDLDLFFARKDRKKKPIWFTRTNELAKKLSEVSKRSQALNVNPESSHTYGHGSEKQGDTAQNGDGKWRDFKVVKKDYSGLKIRNMITVHDYENDYSGNKQDACTFDDNEPWRVVQRKKLASRRALRGNKAGSATQETVQDDVKEEPFESLSATPYAEDPDFDYLF